MTTSESLYPAQIHPLQSPESPQKPQPWDLQQVSGSACSLEGPLPRPTSKTSHPSLRATKIASPKGTFLRQEESSEEVL